MDDPRRELRERETGVEDLPALRRQLMESERKLAELPGLREEVAQLRAERDQIAAQLVAANRAVQLLEQSTSWQVTKPLRALGRRGGRS